jgi:hypothetical protein
LDGSKKVLDELKIVLNDSKKVFDELKRVLNKSNKFLEGENGQASRPTGLKSRFKKGARRKNPNHLSSSLQAIP